MTHHVVLVRHGEVDGGRNLYYGSTDVDLSETGLRQAASLGPRLKDLVPGALVVSSPLKRARHTAIEALGPDVAVEIDPDLREIDFGRWEGRSFESVYEDDPELFRRWSRGDTSFGFPDGESMEHFVARVDRLRRRWLSSDAETVVAFTHGGIIRVLLCQFLELPMKYSARFDVKRGGMSTVVCHDGSATLTGLNLTHQDEKETRCPESP